MCKNFNSNLFIIVIFVQFLKIHKIIIIFAIKLARTNAIRNCIMISDMIIDPACKINDFYSMKQLISLHRYLYVKFNISYIH